MDFISDNLAKIIIAIIAIFAVGISIRYVKKKNSDNNNNEVNQKNNKVGGDQAGRDINK
jgi:uncharacterized protein YxeA